MGFVRGERKGIGDGSVPEMGLFAGYTFHGFVVGVLVRVVVDLERCGGEGCCELFMIVRLLELELEAGKCRGIYLLSDCVLHGREIRSHVCESAYMPETQHRGVLL